MLLFVTTVSGYSCSSMKAGKRVQLIKPSRLVNSAESRQIHVCEKTLNNYQETGRVLKSRRFLSCTLVCMLNSGQDKGSKFRRRGTWLARARTGVAHWVPHHAAWPGVVCYYHPYRALFGDSICSETETKPLVPNTHHAQYTLTVLHSLNHRIKALCLALALHTQ